MKRINKILGIVLVLAMLAGMLIIATPASAGDLSWENVGVPSAAGPNAQITENTTISLFAFAPDGTTAFVYDPTGAGKLYKSGNAGVSWTGTGVGGGLPAGIIAIAVSPNYATDTTVIAATSGALYRSRNGGATFLQVTGWNVATNSTISSINSIDIAPYYIPTGGTALMVAGPDGINLYNDDDSWKMVANTSTVGFVGGTILKAELSPNYQNDAEILAVVSGVQIGGMTAVGTVLETKFATSDWNTTVRPANLRDATPVNITTADTASLAFPSDYDSSSSTLNRVYVGLGETAMVNSNYDVWRVNGSISGAGTVFNATNLKLSDLGPTNVFSIAYIGTVASGTLVAGEFDGSTSVATTPNATAAWSGSANCPTGVRPILAFPTGSTTLYAASASVAGFGSAISTSADYNIFKQISRISVPALANLTLSNWKFNIGTSIDQFILVKDTTNLISILFKSTDAGGTWAAIWRIADGANEIASINPSPTYATDNTVFAPNKVRTVWKSTDGGSTWNNIAATIPSTSTISAFTVIDANSYWLGASGGGIYKSGSYVQVAALGGLSPRVIAALPFGIVAVTSDGSFYVSTDNGATFARIGDPGMFGAFPFAFSFDVPGKTIYAASDADGVIKKWVVGTSTAWANVTTVAGLETMPIAPDGTMYIVVANTNPGTTLQVQRSLNIGTPAPAFAGLNNTTSAPADFNGTPVPGGTAITYNATGYQFAVIYQIINTATSAVNGYPYQIKKYTDLFVAKVVITAPAADASTPQAVNVTWNALSSGGKPVTYKVEVALDKAFTSPITVNGSTAPTTGGTAMYIPAGTLVQGTKYYVRVTATNPLPSRTSDVIAFTVKLAQTGNTSLTGPTGQSIAPGPGANNVPVVPTFQWAAVVGADTYHIQVADNPSFTDPLADATTKDTFFTMSAPLKPGTVYYWRIQAVSGLIASDYVSMVFTTAAPVAPPTATTTQPPQTVQPTIIVTVPPSTPAPVTTPAYIWAIIAIGAVLVIAVIVLIARTRRV